VLSVLKGKNLKSLAEHNEVDFDKERREKFGENIGTAKAKEWVPVKSVLIEILTEKIPEYGVERFFKDQKRAVLLECCKVIDDLEDYSKEELKEFSKDDFVEGIMQNIYTFGLQNLFSAFTITELKLFCVDCQLTVRSSSKEVLLDCLIEQKDFRKAKKKSVQKTKLTEKPKIKKGVKAIDLKSWFLRSELEDWCRKKGIKVGGSKKDIVERIILYLDGERGNKVFPRVKGEDASENSADKKPKKKATRGRPKRESPSRS
jgi:hypothetical protein